MPTSSDTAVNPADGIYNLIVGSNILGSGATLYHLTVGKMPNTPNRCITMRNTGGPRAEPGIAIDYPTVQILARGDSGGSSYSLVYDKMVEVRDALLGIPSGGIFYPELTSITQRGHIQDAGYDDQDRPLVSLNLQLIVSYDTSGFRD